MIKINSLITFSLLASCVSFLLFGSFLLFSDDVSINSILGLLCSLVAISLFYSTRIIHKHNKKIGRIIFLATLCLSCFCIVCFNNTALLFKSWNFLLAGTTLVLFTAVDFITQGKQLRFNKLYRIFIWTTCMLISIALLLKIENTLFYNTIFTCLLIASVLAFFILFKKQKS
jgi:hypothetical protein